MGGVFIHYLPRGAFQIVLKYRETVRFQIEFLQINYLRFAVQIGESNIGLNQWLKRSNPSTHYSSTNYSLLIYQLLITYLPITHYSSTNYSLLIYQLLITHHLPPFIIIYHHLSSSTH